MENDSNVIATSEGIIYNIWIVLAGAAAAAASYNIANQGDPVASPNFFLSIAAFVLACVTMRPRTCPNTGVTTVACVALIFGAFTLTFRDDHLPLAAPAFVVVWLSLLCFCSTHWKHPWKLVPGREVSELLSFTGDVLPVLLLTCAAVATFGFLVVGCVVLYAGDHSELLLEPALLAAAFAMAWVWSDRVLLLPILAAASYTLAGTLPVKESPTRTICNLLVNSKFDSCILAMTFLFIGTLGLLATIVTFLCWLNPAFKGIDHIKAKFDGSLAKAAALVLVILFVLGALVSSINFILSFFSDIYAGVGPATIETGDYARWLAIAFAVTHLGAIASIAIPECYVLSAMTFLGLCIAFEDIGEAGKTNAPFVISLVLAFASNVIAVLFYLFGRYRKAGMDGLTGANTPAKAGFFASLTFRVLLAMCMFIGTCLALTDTVEDLYVFKAGLVLAVMFIAFLAVCEPLLGMIGALLLLPSRAVILAALDNPGVPKNTYVGYTMMVVGLGGLALVTVLSIPCLLNASVFTAPWSEVPDEDAAGGADTEADPHSRAAENATFLDASPTEGSGQSYGTKAAA